jgi:hypothetical protein
MKIWTNLAKFFVLITSFFMLYTSSPALAAPEFCWKDSYGRGVGTIPGACAAGQEKVGLLCYNTCPAGMKRAGVDCHSVCPDGMRDDGLFCRKAEYGRGAGYAIWDKKKCEKKHGSCEKNGALYYPKCRAGFKNVGCCICRPDKPDCGKLGLKAGIDLSCAKKIEVGKVHGAGCGNKQKDAGLCYNSCRSGYNGVGPVCWGQVPKGWVACGMGAAKDKATCASIVFGQVSSVGTLALTVATLGGSSAATSAATSAEKAGKLAELKKKFEEMKQAYEAAKKAHASLRAAENTYKAADASYKAYTAYNTANNAVTEEDLVRMSAQIAAIVDGSGVSATIAAYTYPKCSAYFKGERPKPANASSTPGTTQAASLGDVKWAASTGRLPANAFIGGSEGSRKLAVCRAAYKGGTHPGKVVAGKCNIGWGGKEIVIGKFEVMTDKGVKLAWVKGPSAKGMIIGGSETGRTLPVCRAAYKGGTHPGKVVAGKCNIGWGGKEIVLSTFEVLVQR